VLTESDEEIQMFKSILEHTLHKSGFPSVRGLPVEVLDQLEDIYEFFNCSDEPQRTGFHHVATFFETKTLYHRAISSIFRALTTFRLCTIVSTSSFPTTIDVANTNLLMLPYANRFLMTYITPMNLL
jgi:hypothetical protein